MMQTQTTSYNRFTPGRFLQALAVGRNPSGAAAFIQGQRWTDQRILLAAVDPLTTEGGEADIARQPVGDAFFSGDGPLFRRHAARRHAPCPDAHTDFRIEHRCSRRRGRRGRTDPGSARHVECRDSSAPQIRWHSRYHTRSRGIDRGDGERGHYGRFGDTATATAISENYSFISPNVAGSLPNGAPNFAASGTNAAAISTDLVQLFGMVKGHGRGLALVMDEETAANIHFSSPSMFPDVGPMGGSIAGVPVLITDAARTDESPETRVLGLVNATQVFFADRGRVRLDIATDAALQMSDAPSGAAQQVSLMQTDSVATRAIREVSWYARPGVAAYVTGY